jgi:hypothetical protein
VLNYQERGGSTVSVNIELVQPTEAWNALRDQWDTLLADSVSSSIFLSFDYLSTVYKFFHAVNFEPYILTVKNTDGTLIGIMPFRRSTRRYWGVSQAVLEYLVTWEINKPYVIVRGRWDETLWTGLYDFLEGNPGEWDLLELTEIADALAGATVVEQLFRSQNYRCHLPTGPDGPCVDLTQSWEWFLEKHKKYRAALNRLVLLGSHYRVHAYNCPDTSANYYKPWAARIIATSNVEVLRLSPVSRLRLAGQWVRENF